MGPKSVTHVSESWPAATVSRQLHVFGKGATRTHLEAELADGLAVSARLLRSSGRGQFDVIDAKGIEGCFREAGSVGGLLRVVNAQSRGIRHHTLGTVKRKKQRSAGHVIMRSYGLIDSHLDLGLGVEVGVGELFTL